LHFGIEPFGLRIAVKAILRGVNETQGIGWLTHQPSDAFDDVLTAGFDRTFVIVIPSHILKSV